MGLSRLDSKKCKTILKYKHQYFNNACYESIVSHKDIDGNKEVDEHGEVAIKYLKSPHKNFTCGEINSIVEAYQCGKTTIELGKQFSCSKNTINKLLREQGVNITRSKAMAKLDDEIVIAMYKEMHTAEEIAKRFDVYPQAIIKCLKNYGIEIRSRWDYNKK